jgi:hypothetical protein
MADQAAVPAVANIAPVQQVQSTAGNDAVLQNLAAQLNTPLPSPYTTGVQQRTPNTPTVHPYQDQNTNNRPMSNQAMPMKTAERKNSFAEIGNLIGHAGQNFQDQKNTALKNDITTVMQSKQNVENAQKVQQQAQAVLKDNNASSEAKQQAQTQLQQAQAVMDANKKQLNALLSDPKKQKQLAKAFDISYTDMEQNKTPEIAQALAAKKDIAKNGALNYNNPAELKIAQAAGAAQAPAAAQTPPQPQPGAAAPPQNGAATPAKVPLTITQSFQGKRVPGMLAPGNVNLMARPDIDNGDGSSSSINSMSSEVNGKEVLYPGVGDGKTYPARKLTQAEALDQYQKTHQYLGVFKDATSATAYADTLHADQLKYGNQGQKTPSPKSQTPYADAALAKDMPTMEMNPQYQAALAQKAVAQKQYMAALPSIIKADSASTLANAKAGNAQALAVFKDSNALTKQAMEDADKLKTVNNEIAGRAKVQAMRDSTERADTTARIASLEKIATNRNLTAENIAGIKKNISSDIQTEVNKATTQKNTSHADMLTATNLPKGPERDSAMAIAKANEDSAQRNIDYWQKMMDAKTGTPPPSKPEAKVDGPSGPTLWSTYKVGQGSTLTNARAKELGFGDTNAGASSTDQSATPSAQRTDPTDAEKAAAIKYATEVGPEDDNPHGDEDTDPDKY